MSCLYRVTTELVYFVMKYVNQKTQVVSHWSTLGGTQLERSFILFIFSASWPNSHASFKKY